MLIVRTSVRRSEATWNLLLFSASSACSLKNLIFCIASCCHETHHIGPSEGLNTSDSTNMHLILASGEPEIVLIKIGV